MMRMSAKIEAAEMPEAVQDQALQELGLGIFSDQVAQDR